MKDKNIIICDIDGTIANLQHRLHFIKNPDGSKRERHDTFKRRADWDSFHKECINDEPYTDVIEVLCSLVEGRKWAAGGNRELYFFSGRNDSVRNETEQWLQKHVPITPYSWDGNRLQMRSEGDRRPDTVVKLEMMKSLGLTPDDVLCILDDRQAVVDMWRENGFRVLQVDAWTEPAPVHHLTQEKLESLNKAELMFLIEHERQHTEENSSVAEQNLAADEYINRKLEKKEDEK